MGHTIFLALAGTWTLVLGGDVMLNGIREGTEPLAGIQTVLEAADVAVVNLEIPLTSARTPTARKSAAELKARTQFILKADPKHAAHLAEVGIDAVSLGNNHAMDYGPGGLSEMLGSLQEAGIASSGAGATRGDAKYAAIVAEPGGVRVGMVSMLAYRTRSALWKCTPATATRAGVVDLDLTGTSTQSRDARLRMVVAGVRRHADVVLVALHGGVERQTVPNSYQVDLARAWIDAGADVVVGHHPHVLQGSELYKGHPILYSTGNLVSPLPGASALFRLTFDGTSLVRFEGLPVRIAGGKAKLRAGKDAEAEESRIDKLGAIVGKRYPHPEAVPLGAHWVRPGRRSQAS